MAGKPLGVILNFAAETRNAVRDIDKLTKSVKGVGKSAGGVRGVLSNTLKAGIAGVGVAAVGAGIAFVDMAKAAYADAQAQAKLERTLKRIPGLTDSAAEATGRWIDSMELLTGLSDDEMRSALSRLAVVTGDLTEAQRLSALAADASVASGKSFESTFNAMAKAAGGNVTALRKLFPQLDAGPDKVLTLKEAVDQLTDSYGGAAKAAEDNDLFGRLGTIWGQLKEALGSAALPTLEELADWFADAKNVEALQGWIGSLGDWARAIGDEFAPKVQDFVRWLQSNEGKDAIAQFSENVGHIADAFGNVADAIADVTSAWGKIPEPLRKLLGLPIGKLFDPRVTGPGGSLWTDPPHGGATREGVRAGALDYYKSGKGDKDGGARRLGAITVNVYNGKQEKSVDTAAMALRLAKVGL